MSNGGWLPFLNAYNIPYYKSSGDNVQMSCCLCTDDHSQNLGLSTKTSAYKCWRNTSHRGYSPVRVIEALLKVPREDAKRIAKQYFNWSAGDAESKYGEVKTSEWVEKPKEFYPFTFQEAHEKVFLNYLKRRNLDPHFVINRFQMHYALSGPYANRLIVPIMKGGHWYTWVARTYSADEPKRYLAASAEHVKSQPYQHLFDIDNLLGGKMLVITEGVFDSIAITSSMATGVQATALFGKQISDVQVGLLMKLSQKYDRIALGLDSDAYNDCIEMIERLRWYVPKIEQVYPTKKDWGEMSSKEIRENLLHA
jgi:DNA primase